MKAVFGVLVSGLFALSAQAQTGFSLGQLQVAGGACQDSQSKQVEVSRNSLLIPLVSLVKKAKGDQEKRGACGFALPIQVARNHRLVIRDLSMKGKVDLSRGTHSVINLEIFEAGSRGEIHSREDGSNYRRVRKGIELRKDGNILVTECGAGLILRGNSHSHIQGESRASVVLHEVSLQVDVERCY